MEIAQKRHSTRTRYRFGEQKLEYFVKDPSGEREFSVAYPEVSNERQTAVERNSWLRNAGWFWIALGAFLTWLRLTDGKDGFPVSIWLVIGIGCVIAYHVRVTRFIVLGSSKGNLYVVDDADGARILEQIATRRAAAMRAEYDFFPEGETPERLRRRFAWLRDEGALDEGEYKARLMLVDALEPPTGPTRV
ncbi:MAG: hypothetical protein J0L88_04360 [Xanthomonadales bacterium]|nr:hypothetical protein [Xanthomonadales bacterium]